MGKNRKQSKFPQPSIKPFPKVFVLYLIQNCMSLYNQYISLNDVSWEKVTISNFTSFVLRDTFALKLVYNEKKDMLIAHTLRCPRASRSENYLHIHE